MSISPLVLPDGPAPEPGRTPRPRTVELPARARHSLEQEFAELGKVKVTEGVEYEGRSLDAQRWIESRFSSPTTLIDEPVPWSFWKRVASKMKAVCRHTKEPVLRDSRDMALAYVRSLARNRVDAMTPMRAQMDLHDMLLLACPDCAREGDVAAYRGKMDDALRFLRETVYVEFNNEYMGRGIG